jgi:hypothetical protein
MSNPHTVIVQTVSNDSNNAGRLNIHAAVTFTAATKAKALRKARKFAADFDDTDKVEESAVTAGMTYIRVW